MVDPHRLRRSFIAIPFPPPLLEQLTKLQQQLREQLPELKTPTAKNLHLTLHFLGDQTQEQLAEISLVMLSIGQRKNIFNVTLEGLGFFPNRRRPRILWLGVEPQLELKNLYQELANGLQKLGIATEQRPYRPHLTIGRFRQPPRSTDALCPFLSHSCGTMKIDRMVLYTSELTQHGAIHTPQTTVLLEAAE